MHPSISFEMLYPELSPEEKIVRIASHGFHYAEFWSWRDKNLPHIKAACKKNSLQVSNFSGYRRGDLIDNASHHLLIEDLLSALEAAKLLETPTLMILSNELGEGGVVRHAFPEKSDAEKRAACLAGLKKILALLPDDKHLVLEPLNTKLDHVGYFLPDMENAQSLIQELGDPRLKILCDFYHQGMMGDDPLSLIRRYKADIGYVHIADYPGRHEPTLEKTRWLKLFDALATASYDGFIGFEFNPENDSDQALERIRNLWDAFSG